MPYNRSGAGLLRMEAVPFRGMGADLCVFGARNGFGSDPGARRKHGFARTECPLGMAVAGEAPAHEERFLSGNERHLIDPAVALAAGDTFVYMGAVIEIHKVRQVMDAVPRDGFSAKKAVSDRLEHWPSFQTCE
jgi:hypothetical protein